MEPQPSFEHLPPVLKPCIPVALRKIVIYNMDGIFEVTATAGDAHMGTEDFDNQVLDVRMQDSKRKNRGKDLAENHLAVRHVRTQCDRAKRTSHFSTQATTEIDALLDGTAFPLAFSKAWCKELNMDYFRNAKGPVERGSCDGGIDMRSVHDVVHVRGFTGSPIAQNVIQEFFRTGNRSINPDEALAFLVAGRHFAVHGVADSWWCDDEADRSYDSDTHEKRATNHTVR